jgi:hypothetical protein
MKIIVYIMMLLHLSIELRDVIGFILFLFDCCLIQVWGVPVAEWSPQLAGFTWVRGSILSSHKTNIELFSGGLLKKNINS